MSFVPTNIDGEKWPRTVEKALATGEEFNYGTLLLVNGSDEFAEVGADPSSVAAVSVGGAGSPDEPAFTRLDNKEFPPGRMQGVSVDNGQPFSALFEGTLPTETGGSFGVVEDADGLWRVDFAEVTALVVKLVNLATATVPLTDHDLGNRVIVKFLDAVVQDI